MRPIIGCKFTIPFCFVFCNYWHTSSMKKYLLFTLLVHFAFYSCGSYKNIPHFKDLDRSAPSKEQVENFSLLTIQPADILGINVNSRNPESSSIFNYDQSLQPYYKAPIVSNCILNFNISVFGDIHSP